MELKDFIEKLPVDINGNKGLFGKELNYAKDFLFSLNQFKGKNINVIEKLSITNQKIEVNDTGIISKADITPNVVSVKYDDSITFKDDIDIYAILKTNDDIILRLTQNSIKV